MHTEVSPLSTSVAGILLAALLAPLGLGAADQEQGAPRPQGQFLGSMPTEYPDWFKESFF